MAYIIKLMENAKFSNQQLAIVQKLFINESTDNLSKLYQMGSKPYEWLRTDVMRIFGIVSEIMLGGYKISSISFSLEKAGSMSFNSRIDYSQKKVFFTRGCAKVAYDLFEVVPVSVPQANSFIVIDHNQIGAKEYKLPAFLLHHLIYITNIDAGWRDEAGRVRIIMDVAAMISAIPTGGASLEVDAILF